MEITIKKILTITSVSTLAVGLAACSSSPAPWTQAEDDPWQTKRSDEEPSYSSSSTADTTYSDPVLLAEPDPEPIPEPIVVAEPEPEVIAPVVVQVAQTPEQEIMSLPGSSYAVQVLASGSADKAEQFKSDNGLDDLKVVATDRGGSIMYVVVDIQPDRASADAAAADLQAITGSQPWVRSVAGLQKIVAQ